MLFSELIEQEGLESVVSKTNISGENLNRLLHEEFDQLNRVKALGFLLILEREYKDIDVSQLRQNIKLYYEDNAPADDKVVMIPASSTTGGSFSFFKLFIILSILGGGYYFYSRGELDPLVNQVEDKKEFFDDNKALESNATKEDAQKVVVGKPEPESIRIQTPIAPKMETVTLNKNDSNATKRDKLSSQATKTSSNVKTDKSVASVVQEVSNDFLAKEANKTIVETQKSTETTDVTPITTVTINPTRGMLWYGFINLETKKRREFMKKVSTPFNIDNGTWLLVTGHGYVDVVSEAKTIENADNKKHYFLIDSTDIKEISKKEFRKLNGHRGW